MQNVEQGLTTMANKRKKLAMEDYLDFLNNRTLDLTVSQLSQIITMHGYKRKKFQKSVLKDMLSTIDLMDLRRSTLLDGGISSDARFTMDEVIKDLEDLDWQECRVISLLTQGAGVSESVSAASCGAIYARRKKSNGLGKTVAVEVDNSDIFISRLTQGAGVSESVSATSGCAVYVRRKKPNGLGKTVAVEVDNSAISNGTIVAEGSTTESLKSVECNTLAVVSCPASPLVVSYLSDRQLGRLKKSKKL